MSVISPPRSGSTDGSPPPRGGFPAPGGELPPAPPPPAASPRRRWRWWRFIVGALIVLLCSAGGAAVFVIEQVHSLRDALKQNASLNIGGGVLANAGWGGPETLLLVGNDTRKGFKYYHGYVPDLANEMLLVRLDPSLNYISMMSIPRELMATIYPGRGHGQPFPNRLNAAFRFGIGPLVNSIQRDLGLSVNHVIVATFASFKRAVNEMGCVYSTVDQRYYNQNLGTPGTNYQSINLQPGYQRMCGEQALEFVSFRHTDTSLVRDARDQSFLMDVKKEYGPTLVDNVGKFEHIFGQAVRTDAGLQSSNQILNLLGTLINMSGRHVRQVHFQATLQPTGANPCSCDTATPQQIADSVHAFLYGGSPVPPSQSIAAQAHAVQSKHAFARLPLAPTPTSALGQARAAAAKLPFPLEYPRVEDRAGSWQPPLQRVYAISAPGGTAYPAYVGVFYAGQLGQYYDVQGTTWTTAPQFDSPDETIHVNGRTYYLFFESSNLRMVAWYEHDAVYWVRNSLTDALPNGEMLAIAQQTQPFITSSSGPQHTPVILQAARVPFPTTAKPTISARLMAGGIAALVTLVALPLLMFLGIRRFRDLRQARLQLAGGREVGERLPFDDSLTGLPVREPVVPVLSAVGIDAGLPLGVPTVTRRTPAAPATNGGGLATAPGGNGDGVSALLHPPAASGRWIGAPTMYRRAWYRRTSVWILGALAVALVAGGAAYLLLRHQASPPVRHLKPVTRPLIPTIPVAVLNASQVPGAAGKLARSLRADRIKVSTIGNLTESIPPGNEILYAPGERSQAEVLKRLLGSQVATVAPIDPVSAAAAGSGAQLVVVIS